MSIHFARNGTNPREVPVSSVSTSDPRFGASRLAASDAGSAASDGVVVVMSVAVVLVRLVSGAAP